jgi:peptidoglycan/xylan/chitin deacetylase (PgdA/CDA1 family)
VETRWAAFENPAAGKGMAAQANRGAKGAPYGFVRPGECVTLLDVEGSGVIRRMWMTLDFRSPEALHYLRLDMYWDGAGTAAVSVPLGAFFGAVFGEMSVFENELFSSPEGRSFNCSIPMPFRSGARVTLTNLHPATDERRHHHRVFYDIDLTVGEEHPADVLYFHALYRRERPTELGRDFEVLPRIVGRGRFLGAHIGVLQVPGNSGWWGEGEVKVYLEGDRESPTLAGTGTEDYIGTGWGQARFLNRYQGAFVADNARGRQAFYRYHVPDPVYFRQDCRVTLQQLGGDGRPGVVDMLAAGIPVRPVVVIPRADGVPRNLLEPGAVPFEDPGHGDGFTVFERRDDVQAATFLYLDRAERGAASVAGYRELTAPRWVDAVPERTVVLTFDDAVRTHLTHVAPILEHYGFRATFFVCAEWMSDPEHFLGWAEVAELARRGFEVGNHSWGHGAFNNTDAGERLRGELLQVEQALGEQGVAKPVSFAWPGNAFGPEALAVLRELGYRFARRGMQPEVEYGAVRPGPRFEPAVHDPLLIPTGADAYPDGSLEHFRRVIAGAEAGKAVVLQYHGVPDEVHPWVSTPLAEFEAHMRVLHETGCRVLALRDLGRFLDPDRPVADPLCEARYP